MPAMFAGSTGSYGAGGMLGLSAGGFSGGGLSSGMGLYSGAGLGLGMGMGLGLGGMGLGMGMGMGGVGGGASTLGLGLRGAGMSAGAGAVGGGGAAAMFSSMGGSGVRVGGSAAASGAGATGGAASASFGTLMSRETQKSTLSSLNTRFSSFVARVQDLQRENSALEARLTELTGGSDMTTDTNITVSAAEQETQLQEYRDNIAKASIDVVKLEIELDGIRGVAHELKAKFDFEQGVKLQLETDIEAMRKDIKAAAELHEELDFQKGQLKDELDFIEKMQQEEMAGLETKLGKSFDTSSSIIEVDTGKSFDITEALNKIRAEYEATVRTHKEEADTYYKAKMEEFKAEEESTTTALSTTKEELSTSKKELLTLQLELENLVHKSVSLEQQLVEAQAQSSGAVAGYEAQIRGLEVSIEGAKSDLLKQILSYQELLDIKLALDTEIHSYKVLLEGMESSDFSAAFSAASAASSSLNLSKSPATSVRSSSPVNPATQDMLSLAQGSEEMERASSTTLTESISSQCYSETTVETTVETRKAEIIIREEIVNMTSSEPED